MFGRVNLRRNNFEVKYQTVGDFTYCYAERGKPSPNVPSILFLHGLSATKEMWFPMVTVSFVITNFAFFETGITTLLRLSLAIERFEQT